MLAHFNTIFPLSILVASLLGSGHCVAMCGGIALMVSKKSSDSIRYHVGRLLGYTSLGAAAGALGGSLFHLKALTFLPWIATVMLSSSLILMGIQMWRGESPHLFRIPPPWLAKIRKVFGHGPIAMGIFTSILPCGWLHTFLIAAVASQSALRGSMVLFYFWLGTVPALHFSPWAITHFLRPIAQKLPKLSAFCLILIGLLSIGIKLLPTKNSSECAMHSHFGHCHAEK